MKTKKNRITLVLALGFVLTLAVGGLTAVGSKEGKTVYASEVSVDGIRTEYMYNESLTIPKTATMTINDTEYESDSFYVILPNGNRVSFSKLTLDECGEYTIVYEKAVDNKYYSAEKKFTVKKKVFELTSGSESIEYGAVNKSFNEMGYTTGLNVGLAEGDVFAMNEPYNIYENDLQDMISFNCMQTADALCNFITLRLTDCYDPSIYMDITYTRGDMYYATYITAGTCGGRSVGLTINEQGNINVDGDTYVIDTNGTGVFGNNPQGASYSNLTYYLNTADRDKLQVHVRVGKGISDALVTEINNEKIYAYSFKGFTDGNVFLSLRASSLNGVSEAPIQIAKFGKYSGEDFGSFGYYNDEASPIFTPSDFEREYKIAVGKEVTVPEVKALDDYGIRGISDYAVIYEKNTTGASNVSVKNGKFVPTKAGAYTIDYFAYDLFGNRSELSLNLFAVDAESGITAEKKVMADITAGDKMRLSDAVEITSLNEDMLQVNVTLRYPSGKAVIANGYDQEYTFNEVGTYSIKYEYSDIFYNEELTLEVKVLPNATPIFESNKLYTNKYYIKGAEYSLMNVKAWNYTAEGSKIATTKSYVKYDSGSYTEFDPKEFTISGNTSVQFKTAWANDESVYIESDVRKIVDVDYADEVEIAKYFEGDVTVDVEDRVPTITATKTSPNVDFINPVLFSQFALTYEIPLNNGRKQNVTSATITLTDYFNANNTFEIALSGINNKYFANVNGESFAIDSEWNGEELPLKISENKLLINSRTIDITNPFENNLCFLSIRFNGAEAGFKAQIKGICNQNLFTVNSSSTKVADGIAPIIYAKLPESVGLLGQEIVLSKPYAMDVLSPSSYQKLTLTVMLNGKAIKDETGRELRTITDFESEIKFVLTDYGRYSIVYNYTDGNGKRSNACSQIVSVIDAEAPTLSLPDEGKTINVKAGEAFTPKYEAKDNVTEKGNLKVYFVVENSNACFVLVSNSEIVINAPGKYTVIVYVSDEVNNTVSKTYYVNVA